MLAQIDETSALTTQASDSVTLPTLLVRRTQSEPLGDNTPESVPMLPAKGSIHGEATPIAEPECWPATPTPRNTGGPQGFALGGGGEKTPEAWDGMHPNFRFGMQQQQLQQQQLLAGSFQGMTMAPMPFFGAMPMPGAPTGAAMTPMWPGMMQGMMPGMPAGMVPGMMPMPAANVPSQHMNQTDAGFELAPRRLQLPLETRQEPQGHGPKGDRENTSVRTSGAGGKKNSTNVSGAGGSNSSGQPACPVAVYVDLSTLREKLPSGRSRRGS